MSLQDFSSITSLISSAISSKPKARSWPTLGPTIGSDESLIKIRGWDSSCQVSHKYCNLNRGRDAFSRLGTNTFFPTRVIDVERVNDGIISLRHKAEVAVQSSIEKDKYPVYWTLSHRWGNTNNMPRLLKDTESRLREGVSLDRLPPIDRTWPAFRDAALLVKRLGYRYLWIDSLCIFQDSESEWQREASMMVDIYRHSYCNISAISSSHDPANHGLFGRRRLPERLFYPVKVNMAGHLQWLRCDPRWEGEVQETPLNRRGWVVQERFLSTRTIYFAKNQIFWECLEETNSESQRGSKASLWLGDFDDDGDRLHCGKSAVLNFHKLKERASKPYIRLPWKGDILSEIYREWGYIVGYYMTCGLTKESDRLIAISGIAKAFQEATGDTYLAGLWKSALYSGLIWHAFSTTSDRIRRHEHAPSWSWASLTKCNVHISCSVPDSQDISCIKLVEERIVPKALDGDSFGQLQSAELEIECMVCYLRLERADERIQKAWVYHDEARTRCCFEGDSDILIFYDTSDSYEDFRRKKRRKANFLLTFIPIHRRGYNRVFFSLVLEYKANNKFKRVGRMQWKLLDNQVSFIDEWAGQKSRIVLI
ncbi:HET-domain-containing protein [Daldinia eschscholtzii]|nr:HET-domain-containing protein [Daldinia eschscholtzii]